MFPQMAFPTTSMTNAISPTVTNEKQLTTEAYQFLAFDQAVAARQYAGYST